MCSAAARFPLNRWSSAASLVPTCRWSVLMTACFMSCASKDGEVVVNFISSPS